MPVKNLRLSTRRGIELGPQSGPDGWLRPVTARPLVDIAVEIETETQKRCGGLGKQACQPTIDMTRGEGDSIEAVTLECLTADCPYFTTVS